MAIITDDDSEIYVDDNWIAVGSFKFDLPLGKHKIETRHRSGVKTVRNVTIQSKEMITLQMYNKPLENKAKLYCFIPGVSQIYKKQKIKGIFIQGVIITSAVMSLQYFMAYRDDNSEYENNRDLYKEETLRNNVINLFNKTQSYYDSAKSNAQKRDTFLLICLGTYTYNLLDAVFWPPKAGYRDDTDKKITHSFHVKATENMIKIGAEINF